jgi:hypothetical protein
MAIGDDFSVNVAGDIRHVANTNNYTVLELHRWLGDLADDASAAGNDLVDITSDTPSERSTDNIITLNAPYNIDDDAAEYLYAGSITQDDGDTVYSGLRVLGAVNTAATQLMVIQNNKSYPFTPTPAAPFWGTQSGGGYNGNAASGVLMRCLIKTREFGADIDGKRVRVQARHWTDTYDFFNVTLGQGESVAAIGTTPDAQNTSTQGLVTAYTHVSNSGGTTNAPTGGYQLIDLNNTNGAQPYYSKWTYGNDSNGDGLKSIWEYIKDLSGNGSTKTIDSLNGELFLGITHEFNYDSEESGPFTERETVSWGSNCVYGTLVGGTFTVGNRIAFGNGFGGQITRDNGSTTATIMLDVGATLPTGSDTMTEYEDSDVATGVTAIVTTFTGAAGNGGTGLLLALNDAGVTGDLWVQILTGTAPGADEVVTGNSSGATAATSGTPVSKTIPKIFLGSYTGTLIGAYGIGVAEDNLSAADTIEDLLNATQTPPNNVTFTVSGLVNGDRVLVGPRNAGILQKDQFATANTLAAGSTTSTIVGLIPSDTPTTGTVRIASNTGVYLRTPYSSYANSDFTITAYGDSSTAGNDLFISYIDDSATGATLSFTSVFDVSRDLFVRVRDGGATPIKTFEAPATLGTGGGSVAAIRTSDE